MKSRFLLFASALLATLAASHAATVYSGIQNIPIPYTFDGVYLRIDTGATAGLEPGSWNTAPWMNPFQGGVNIGTDALFLPVAVTGSDQIVNLPLGTPIGLGSNFATGESGSSTHFGVAANQFQNGVPGYIGFSFKQTVGGPELYGWMNVAINNAGPGNIISWAYQNVAGTSITAGFIDPIPEPGTALFGLALVAAAATRHRRRARA